MSMQKSRWSKVYESSEEELLDFLRQRNVHAERIAVEAMSEPTQQSADLETTIWCAEGSFTLSGDSTTISVQPGDAVRIDADTTYSLRPGISGYVCYRN
jgi:mannose-6-phosphate isomerase class I